MATAPFLGEIRSFSFNFAPRGWAMCNGQLLNISQNTALFSLLGTNYGGNGQTTFGLPNLQGRAPIGQGTGSGTSYVVGQNGGSATVALTGTQVPAHTHTAAGSTGLSTNAPGTTVLPGTFASTPAYTTSTAGLVAMNTSAVGFTGAGQAHENRQPSLALNICIALQGIFPSRS